MENMNQWWTVSKNNSFKCKTAEVPQLPNPSQLWLCCDQVVLAWLLDYSTISDNVSEQENTLSAKDREEVI